MHSRLRRERTCEYWHAKLNINTCGLSAKKVLSYNLPQQQSGTNMKNTLFAAVAALFAMTTTAMAFDVAPNLAFDNTIEAVANVEAAEDFTLEYTANVNYAITSDVLVYAETEVDVRDPDFVGMEAGIDWTAAEGLTLSAYATVDDEFKNEQMFVSAAFTF
jgi:hypothetical protein